jgi:hypothetical protein
MWARLGFDFSSGFDIRFIVVLIVFGATLASLAAFGLTQFRSGRLESRLVPSGIAARNYAAAATWPAAEIKNGHWPSGAHWLEEAGAGKFSMQASWTPRSFAANCPGGKDPFGGRQLSLLAHRLSGRHWFVVFLSPSS